MNRAGFTLIELLVVIAIIVILAAMLIAGTGSAVDTARRQASLAHLKLIDEGIGLYHNEFRSYPPAIDSDGDGQLSSAEAATNNLGWALAAPKSLIPTDDAQRKLLRDRVGYPGRYLRGDLDPRFIDLDGNDPDAPDPARLVLHPMAIRDRWGDDQGPGRPLIYIHLASGRATVADVAAVDHPATSHAYSGFEKQYELWTAGHDGLVDPDFHLHDTELSENVDNVTVTPYRPGDGS